MRLNNATPINGSKVINLLLSEKNSLLRLLGVRTATEGVEPEFLAADDQAPNNHEQFISSTVRHLLGEKLRLVEAALERIETGSYGVCAECGDPISEKRLRALPWAELCVDCESGEGRFTRAA
jgi:RNA polymerase-binding transcription factor DksA